MKSYSGCGFSLMLPDVISSDNRVIFTTNLQYKIGSEIRLVFQHAVFTNIFGEKYVSQSPPRFIQKSGALSVEVTPAKKVHFFKKTSWKLTFLSSNSEKIIVVFSFASSDKASLVDVIRCEMTDLEKSIYVLAKENAKKALSSEQENQKPEIEPEHHIAPDSASFISSYSSIEKYRAALKTECKFLQNEGGQKHKVTNGKLIIKSNGTYTYVFDLETELHISDDAPISVSFSGTKTQGTVIMCEDFQIMVQLEYNIGEAIGSAYIRQYVMTSDL